jgi:hypothetical protein
MRQLASALAAVALLAAGGCGGGEATTTVTETTAATTPEGTTAESSTASTGTGAEVRSCLEGEGLTTSPPPDSVAVDVGAAPAFEASFPDGGNRIVVYVAGSEDEAEQVGRDLEDFIRGFGTENAEDYVVQGGSAVATFEEAAASDDDRAVLESCFS